MPMLRSSMGTWVMSFPFTTTLPDTGSIKPVRVRRVVVFPQPEGPRKVKNSPSFTWTLMLCRAVKSPNLTTMSFKRIIEASPSLSKLVLLSWLEQGCGHKTVPHPNEGAGKVKFAVYPRVWRMMYQPADWVSVVQSRLSQSGSEAAPLASAQ